MGDIVHIGQLTADPNNARAHNPRNVGMLEKALNEVGAARSIVIDEDGVVLAGNATIDAAAQAGIERVQVVEADGETIIAVRRRGLTPEQKTKLALYDNRVAELAEWDAGRLADLGEQDVDLSSYFFPHELANILEQAGTEMIKADDLWKGMPEFENEAGAARTLHVHFPTMEDCAEFCRLLNLAITEKTKTVWYPNAPERDKHIFVNDES